MCSSCLCQPKDRTWTVPSCPALAPANLHHINTTIIVTSPSVLAERLAGNRVSDITYLVPSGTLNLHSINQSINHYITNEYRISWRLLSCPHHYSINHQNHNLKHHCHLCFNGHFPDKSEFARVHSISPAEKFCGLCGIKVECSLTIQKVTS